MDKSVKPNIFATLLKFRKDNSLTRPNAYFIIELAMAFTIAVVWMFVIHLLKVCRFGTFE